MHSCHFMFYQRSRFLLGGHDQKPFKKYDAN